MRATTTHTAIGAIVFFLTVLVLHLRLAVPGPGTDVSQPDLHPGNDFCVGVDHPDTVQSLVCASGPTGVIAEAVHRVDLPAECLDAAVPRDLRPGDLILFETKDDICRIERVEPLGSAQRLLCGGGIDVNRDGIEGLGLLPGIGPVRARAIVDEREARGPFDGPQDLERVRGIGPKIVEGLEPFLEWSGSGHCECPAVRL